MNPFFQLSETWNSHPKLKSHSGNFYKNIQSLSSSQSVVKLDKKYIQYHTKAYSFNKTLILKTREIQNLQLREQSNNEHNKYIFSPSWWGFNCSTVLVKGHSFHGCLSAQLQHPLLAWRCNICFSDLQIINTFCMRKCNILIWRPPMTSAGTGGGWGGPECSSSTELTARLPPPSYPRFGFLRAKAWLMQLPDTH